MKSYCFQIELQIYKEMIYKLHPQLKSCYCDTVIQIFKVMVYHPWKKNCHFQPDFRFAKWQFIPLKKEKLPLSARISDFESNGYPPQLENENFQVWLSQSSQSGRVIYSAILAACSTDGHGFEPQTSTNACGHVCR